MYNELALEHIAVSLILFITFATSIFACSAGYSCITLSIGCVLNTEVWRIDGQYRELFYYISMYNIFSRVYYNEHIALKRYFVFSFIRGNYFYN